MAMKKYSTYIVIIPVCRLIDFLFYYHCKKKKKRRFSHEAAAYWNQLPNIVRQAPSKKSFANLYWKMVP